MVIVRRFLVVAALMFWQGGFTFYASIVVPVGQDVLGSHLSQGMITRQVTTYLNLAGAIALLPLAWDIAADKEVRPRRRLMRGLMWLGMALSLVALYVLHVRLDHLIDPIEPAIADRTLFRLEHRTYLWISTTQWTCSLCFTLLTLQAWQKADRSTGIDSAANTASTCELKPASDTSSDAVGAVT